MKAKKIIILGIVLILMMSFSSFVFAKDTPILKLNLINHDPDPARPGEYVDIKVRLDNEGPGFATGVKINFIEEYPFSLNPDDTSLKNIGSIGPYQKENLGVVVSYKVRISSDAVQGRNKVRISFSSDNQATQTMEFNIEVRTEDSGLNIKEVKSEILEPGKEGFVEIIVQNPSDSILREVNINLDLSSDLLPIAPADSATNKKVRYMQPNSESIFRFSLRPFPDADSKVYKIPLTITYFDASNQLVTKNDIIGIVVGSDAQVSYYVNADNFNLGATQGVISFNFINKGLTNIKFLDVVLEDTDDYEVIGSNGAYIGNVDSDDYESVDYVILKKTNVNPLNLNFKLTFKDANNKEYFEDISLELKQYSAPKSKGISAWIWIVLILIIVFFAYKKFKKNRRKN